MYSTRKFRIIRSKNCTEGIYQNLSQIFFLLNKLHRLLGHPKSFRAQVNLTHFFLI